MDGGVGRAEFFLGRMANPLRVSHANTASIKERGEGEIDTIAVGEGERDLCRLQTD